MSKTSELESVDLVFENCNSVTLTQDDNVKTVLRVDCEDYYGDLFALDGRDEKFLYNHFFTNQHSSYARIEFNKSALNKETRMGEPCGSYIKDKEITHIDLRLNGGNSYYISVPYLPISDKYGLYNLYQKETIDRDTMILTFTKNNLLGNLPNAFLWLIRFVRRLIKYRIAMKKAGNADG